MSTEINTRGMVRSMFSTFPSGNDAECLTKQTLLSGSSNLMNVSGGDTECVPLEAIGFKAYPCKSQTDKAPLGNNFTARIAGANHNYIWLSSAVRLVSSIAMTIGGLDTPNSANNIAVGEESVTYPGIVLKNEGDKIDLYGYKGLIVPTGMNLMVRFEIDGMEYTINILTL